MSWVRIAVVVMLVIEGLYFTLVAFGNITDYATNYAFVKGVMSMNTTFHDKDLMWRAITSPVLYHLSYAGIIAWESATAVVCWVAVVFGIRSLRPSVSFERARNVSILALLMSIALWAGAFITVGGEWFAMWQSTKWNGLAPALQNFTISGIALAVVILARDEAQPSIAPQRSEGESPG